MAESTALAPASWARSQRDNVPTANREMPAPTPLGCLLLLLLPLLLLGLDASPISCTSARLKLSFYCLLHVQQ